MKPLFYLSILLLILPMPLCAQERDDSLRIDTLPPIMLLSSNTGSEQQPGVPDIPASPQAVAFNHLGDYQLNNNYGVPDINIPLFEIDHHGYKIPLALHYEATPMKPGYNYDVTGWGWTLSGNSCVSRTIKDRADEHARRKRFALDSFYSTSQSGQNDYEYLYYENQNLLDKVNFQYDSYNVVLPSGRTIPFFMYMDNDNYMHYSLMPRDGNVKISCDYNTMGSFTVIDENGITYNFTIPEKYTNAFQDDPNADCYVSWLLASIEIPSKGIIYYQYTEDPVVIQVQNVSNEPAISVSRLYDTFTELRFTPRLRVSCSFQTQSPRYEMRFLRRIVYGPTMVNFNYQDDVQHMREITVSDNGETIRKISLNVEGSTSEPCWQLKSLVISGQDEEDKLRYSFSYHSRNPGEYTDFWGNRCDHGTLNNAGMSNLGNFNMFFDYTGGEWAWGELQNRLRTSGNIAQLIEGNENDPTSHYYKLKLQTTTEGDTRVPTAPERHGVLQRITYPNGGYSYFSFENHRFPTASSAEGDIIIDRRRQRIIEGGGFRIKYIISYTADGELASEDYYKYGYTIGDVLNRNFPLPLNGDLNAINDTINQHVGCGEAVVDPNLFTFMSGFSCSLASKTGQQTGITYNPNEFRKMLRGYDSRFRNIYYYPQNIIWWEVTFSANKFRSLIGGRRPVVYPEITIYHGDPNDWSECKSKTVCRYDIYKYQNSTYPGLNYLDVTDNRVAVPDTTYFEPLLFDESYPALECREYPADRHNMKSKEEYSFNEDTRQWELALREEYIYDKQYISMSGYIFESYISRNNYLPANGSSSYESGYSHPLHNVPLRAFYKACRQYVGKSTLGNRIITQFRKNRPHFINYTKEETYSYLYPDILKQKRNTDIYDSELYMDYERKNIYTYVGEQENNDSPIINEMKSRNMLASVISSEICSTCRIEGTKIDYDEYDGNILPSTIYEWQGNDDGEGEYVPSIHIDSYQSYNNPSEIHDLRTGMPCVYIWDSEGRYMTAMIRNATYEQVASVLSELTGDSRTRYNTLHSRLPGTQVETWDYKPLVGVSAHTDASGNTMLYEYDGLGRLTSEKRIVNGASEPEIIKEYEYNFLNEAL